MDNIFPSLLAIIRVHPLREFRIRTHSDLGAEVWSELITVTGLRKISIWCMEGPPRVLQGWSESLGDTLTELELGVSIYSVPCCKHPSNFYLLSFNTPCSDVLASHRRSSSQCCRCSPSSGIYV